MSELKLKVGKTYRNRKGGLCEIVGTSTVSSYPFEDSDGILYTETGKFDMYDDESEFDLVSEVVPEPMPTAFNWDVFLATLKEDSWVPLSLYEAILRAVEAARGKSPKPTPPELAAGQVYTYLGRPRIIMMVDGELKAYDLDGRLQSGTTLESLVADGAYVYAAESLSEYVKQGGKL